MYSRKYRITVLNPDNKVIVIENPFTAYFSIVRNMLASVNSLDLTIEDLAPETRSELFKDRYTFTQYWRILVEAGYEDEGINKVFTGNIRQCYSYKIKSKWFTKIEGFDGEYAIQNGTTNATFSKNTDLSRILENVVKDMPNMVKGLFGEKAEGQTQKGMSLMGNSKQIIDDLTGGQYFIDNEKLNILQDYEYVGNVGLVLDSSRLLSTPRRRETFLDCETLFFSFANLGFLVEIQSKQEEFNGVYNMIGFKHDFLSSEARAGRAVTMLNLSAGTNTLRKANP